MNKIPTLFERDWNGDRSRVTSVVHPGCEWVLNGEGRATRKLDGTCCRIHLGQLYKRRELRKGDPEPAGFEFVAHDDETGKTVGWMPITDEPSDRYHREAITDKTLADGTYELVGPKVQGNPENSSSHRLELHGAIDLPDVPRDFETLSAYLSNRDIEGIVWHHPDGRMAKIKGRDFGIKRPKT